MGFDCVFIAVTQMTIENSQKCDEIHEEVRSLSVLERNLQSQNQPKNSFTRSACVKWAKEIQTKCKSDRAYCF